MAYVVANADEIERQLDEWDLVIKVKHGDTLRRIGAYIHRQLMNFNMSKLKSKIISLFKFSHDAELILSYTDEDGDVVTIDDDDELRDAVIGQRLNPLRINIQLKYPESYDARTAPSNLPNAQQPEILPTLDEQEKFILGPLLGVVSDLVGIAHKAISSSPAFAQKVDAVMKSEPFRSTMESLSKDVKKATSSSPALVQVVEHLSKLGLSNAGQTLGTNGDSSGVHSGASTHPRDPNVTEQPKGSNETILETYELTSDMTCSESSDNPIPNEKGSVTMVQGSGVSAPSVDLSMDASKNADASLFLIDDLMASTWTANHIPAHEKHVGSTNLDGRSVAATVTTFPPVNTALHGSGNFSTPGQPFPTCVDGSADITNGGSSHKQSPMKADPFTPSHAGFNSHAKLFNQRTICSANYYPAHEKDVGSTNLDGRSVAATVTTFPPVNTALRGSGNFSTPGQPFPTFVGGSADIMNGGSSSKQSTMKADSFPSSQAGFDSHAKVSISQPFGATLHDDLHKLPEVMNTFSRQRSHIINESIPRTFHSGVQCDGCGMHPIVGPRFKSIVKENYDLCDICFTQMGSEADYTRIDNARHHAHMRHLFHNHHTKICFPPSNVLRGCDVRRCRGKLDSCFIQYATVLDGTVVPPSTHFTKTWRVRNNGTIPWPFGTQLVWVGGDQFGERVTADLEIPPSGFPVDQELEVVVDFTAPSRPGHHVSYWRMASPSGQKFGQRAWALIQVPNSAAGSGFYTNVNLNHLPHENNGQNGSVNIDVNAEPLDSSLLTGTNGAFAEVVVVDVPSGNVEQPARMVGGLLDASNDELSTPTLVAVASPSASYHLIDLQETPSLVDAYPPVEAAAGDGNTVEQTMLKELEEMGFKQIDLNKEILRRNAYDMEQSINDLCGFP